MKSILFVCTGNIFRSMTAEYALKAVLGPEADYAVTSAGTLAPPQEMLFHVKERLLQRGIDPAGHRQRKLTAEMLDEADLVVAMGFDHRDYIRAQFEWEAVLFNEICCGKEEPVLDIGEAIPSWNSDREARIAYAISVVDYICERMPALLQNMGRFF